MSDSKTSSYGNIFKTTFLFGFVQVYKALISIIVNKLAAMLIGPNGMGLLGIYNSTISLIQTGASLGLNQSAVRDVAEANGTGNRERRDRIISVTLKAVLFTGILGLIVTILLSSFISEWTLGDNSHGYIYCVLAIVICLNIINDGRQAVIKGMRLMRYLALASIIGSSASLFISIPLYLLLGTDGIVPSLLLSSMLALFVSNFYISKIGVSKVHLSIKEMVTEASPMVRIGTVLMFVTFLQTIVAFCINSFVRKEGGIEDVGFYSTGQYILSGYFGLIITALTTDYYPRIAAINGNNTELKKELNKQTLVTMVLCCPMIILFISLMPILISILYTEEFLSVIEYVKIAIFSTIIMSCSNLLDMILIVKQDSKVLLTLSILIRIFHLGSSFLLYAIYGLTGLGISIVLVTGIHLVLVSCVAYQKYGIFYDKTNISLFATIVLMTMIALSTLYMENTIYRYVVATGIIILAIIFSYICMRKFMNIDLIKFIKTKLR